MCFMGPIESKSVRNFDWVHWKKFWFLDHKRGVLIISGIFPVATYPKAGKILKNPFKKGAVSVILHPPPIELIRPLPSVYLG